MILSSYILGTLEDATAYFVFPLFYDLFSESFIQRYAFPFGIHHSIFDYSEPLSLSYLFFIAKFIDPVIGFNIFIISTTILTYITLYKLVGLFSSSKYINAILPLTYLFSPYFLYNIRSHPQLSQVWIAVVFLYFFLKLRISNSLFNRNHLKLYHVGLGLILGLIILTSNYIGFFMLQFIAIFVVLELIILVKKGEFPIKQYIVNNIIFFLTFLITSAVWIYPFLTANYITHDASSAGYLNRPIDEFVYFSSRPWYWILPSADNYWFGNITLGVISQLQTKWGYFLTQNYFRDEHSSMYIGWVNLGILIYTFANIRRFKNHRSLIGILAVTNICLYLLSLPPFITFNDTVIYTPSYILYKLFPMFRVLSRVGFLTNLINLVIISCGIGFIYNKTQSIKLFMRIAIYIIVFISIMETMIPIALTKVQPIPQVSIAIKNLPISDQESIAVYPYKYSTFSFYWMRNYSKNLTNPKDYRSNNFDSRIFTNELRTCEGLKKASSLGVKYIVVYNTNETNKDWFDNNSFLSKELSIESNLYKENSIHTALFVINDFTVYPNTYIYRVAENVVCD